MLAPLYLFAHAASQGETGLENLNPERVATGLQTQGGWYLSAIAILVALYLGRKILVMQDKAHKRSQEQTALFSKHLDKRDKEVRELLQASTEALADVGASLGTIAVELRELKNETRTGFDTVREEARNGCKAK